MDRPVSIYRQEQSHLCQEPKKFQHKSKLCWYGLEENTTTICLTNSQFEIYFSVTLQDDCQSPAAQFLEKLAL